jgi:hypothetical protein
MLSRREIYLQRAKATGEMAKSAEAMGMSEIAQAYSDIEKPWLKMAEQTELMA